MSGYGLEIVDTLIVDIEPDQHVKKSMNEINAVARMRVAANEKAEAEKILQIKRVEGEAESKYLSGLGIARQHQAIVDGLSCHFTGFRVLIVVDIDVSYVTLNSLISSHPQPKRASHLRSGLISSFYCFHMSFHRPSKVLFRLFYKKNLALDWYMGFE
ncbi:unnamed protein product [Lactuca virosa]|uniref:Band 7 domain-containing protein n=1 Tax=Lactuca virosa TaxID=75947 RepID=A0AAU9P966_9ASTR|nr:unnamed protein product [Lactuca virosa]